jgi:phage shock protein A
MGDVGMAIQRAEDKTAQMQARAGAIDELLASGALDDAIGPKRDDIQSELDAISAGSDVESELRRLRGEIAGPQAKQLEGGANGGQAANQAQPPSSQQTPYSAPQALPVSDLPVSDLPVADDVEGGAGA